MSIYCSAVILIQPRIFFGPGLDYSNARKMRNIAIPALTCNTILCHIHGTVIFMPFLSFFTFLSLNWKYRNNANLMVEKIFFQIHENNTPDNTKIAYLTPIWWWTKQILKHNISSALWYSHGSTLEHKTKSQFGVTEKYCR